MNACIIFDVSHNLTDVKAQLKQLGYWGAWSGNGKTYTLPSNSLWKPNCELAQAKNEIQNAIAIFNTKAENINNPIILERCIILPVNPWDGIEGKPIT